MQSAQGAFSLRSVSFAIVAALRCRLCGSFAQHASASLHPAQQALRLRALLMERSHDYGLSPSSPPQLLAALGQVRNSRLATLPLAMLLCSPRFRLAASRTAGASAPRPRRAQWMNEVHIIAPSVNSGVLSQSDSRFRFSRPRQRPFACFPAGLPGAFSHRACSGRTAND